MNKAAIDRMVKLYLNGVGAEICVAAMLDIFRQEGKLNNVEQARLIIEFIETCKVEQR